MTATFAAIDLGASSGRVMLADVTQGGVRLREVHRFPNRPVEVHGRLHWDVLSLWAGALDGLRIAARDAGPLVGIAVDSWGVDYGLLDADGRLLGNPVHYRDGRTDGVADRVHATVPHESLYGVAGIQQLPFNTVYQLAADRTSAAMRAASSALLIPDLFSFWLTGRQVTELTNASTTSLVDARSRDWAGKLFTDLDLREDLFPGIVAPGHVIGPLLPAVAAEIGCPEGVVVTAVGSHDTASAVAGVPARGENFAYISCGTWSLVGLELDEPVTSEAARSANFSNELGVDGTVRFLGNVMGLWLLQESVRTWERSGERVDLERLLRETAEVPAGRSVIDPDRPQFLPPGDMPARIREECARTAQPVPQAPAEITRCILDSLAAAYRRRIRLGCELTGRQVDVIHVVGGGARNSLLCQLTADACGVPVVAGPVEGAAYGNVLVQARSAGVLDGSLRDLRAAIPLTDTVTYTPRVQPPR